MYRIIRSILFLWQPETIHDFVSSFLKLLNKIPLIPSLIRLFYCYRKPCLEREVFGVKFRNPVGMAAGFDKDGDAYNALANFGFGFVEIGSLTPKPQEGNPKPRCFRLTRDKALINRMGINNKGIKHAVSYIQKHRNACPIGCSITKGRETLMQDAYKDYEFSFEYMYDFVDYFVLNVSCPNVKEGGAQFGTSPESVEKITSAVRRHCTKPLIIKLSPNVADIAAVARAAEGAGADAVSLINTLTGMRIDINTRRPIIKNVTGGMSGPAVFPVAVRMVYQVKKAVKIPVIGLGGISTWQDAVEMIMAGADAIQIGTVLFTDPYAPLKISEGLHGYLDTHNIPSVRELTATVEV